VLPGYALTAALFSRVQLPFERAAMLTLALSLSALSLGSLIVNFSPGGLRIGGWAAFLLLVVVGGCAVAHVRGHQPPDVAALARGLRIRRGAAGLLLAALALTAAATVLAKTELPAHNVVGYTGLWMLPGPDANGSPAVRIGVESAERDVTTYRLELQMGNGGRVVAVDPQLTLRPGTKAQFTVALTPALIGRSAGGLVSARLYRAGGLVAYREVTARLPGSP
jgi:hypothetical protein